MAAARPFLRIADLHSKAASIWWSLEPEDWLEAFRSHPKIGENKASVQSNKDNKRDRHFQTWSEQEQATVRNANQETMNAMAQRNREYEERFGFIFIVCATGKSSEEMLAILQDRLGNDAASELPIAAAEQAKITELRLNKLLAMGD